jgi:hypothetical protein
MVVFGDYCVAKMYCIKELIGNIFVQGVAVALSGAVAGEEHSARF